jgi:hypothetical protein
MSHVPYSQEGTARHTAPSNTINSERQRQETSNIREQQKEPGTKAKRVERPAWRSTSPARSRAEAQGFARVAGTNRRLQLSFLGQNPGTR